MTILEALLIIIIIALIAFVIYYYFRGTSGKVSITRPMESRVDEYLDRRFEQMVSEWSLMNKYQVRSFKDKKEKVLADQENKVEVLKDFEHDMIDTLARLEERLNALEKQVEK